MPGDSVKIGIAGGTHTVDGVLIKDGNILSVKEYVTTDDLLMHVDNCLKRRLHLMTYPF